MSFIKNVWGVDVIFYPKRLDGLSISKFWDLVKINDGLYSFPYSCEFFKFHPNMYGYFSNSTLRYYPSIDIIRPFDKKVFTIIFDNIDEFHNDSSSLGCLVSYGSSMYDILNNFYSDIMHVIYLYVVGKIDGEGKTL